MAQTGGNYTTLKFGYYSSIFLTGLTVIAFGFAMIAVPASGPYCHGDCMNYPYSNLLQYFPHDYYWMYFAIFQLFAFLVFVISHHFNAPDEKRIYSFTSIAFAIISVTVLLSDYFIQFSVIPISAIKGETEGVSLITQYNGHGIFIALEELGYITMSITFFFLFPVYSTKNRLQRTIRLLLIMPILLTGLSFIFYTIKFGIDRSYRFEVATISINWIVCIIIGILVTIYTKQEIKRNISN